jgi:hypothetical protein
MAACALALALAPAASAFVYWADTQNSTIGRANNDGTGVDDAFAHTGALPFAVAVDASHVYWVNQNGGTIGRANLDGTGVDNSFITGIKEPDGIAVNGTSIYWGTIPGPIGRANIDGSAPNFKFITAASQPCGLALDGGHVYWADESFAPVHIGRAGLDGSFPQPEYVSFEGFPCGVAVNSANIYWADTGFFGGGTKIGRADLATGKSVDPNFIVGASTPCGIALDDSSHLYWANSGANTIARANTDGTGVNQSFIATGGSQPCGVAVDSGYSPPPPGPEPPTPTADAEPPQTRIVQGPGKALAKGVARFRFRSSEAGSAFLCKLDKRKAARCGSPKAYRHLKPGRHLFKVWAIDAAGNKDPTPARRRFRIR